MAIRLKVNELIAFEEKAGVSWVKAQKALAPSICKPHRLAISACANCQAISGGFCDQHVADVNDCDACEGADVPMKILAALAWLLRCRREPITWEAFGAEADSDDMRAELNQLLLGNA